MNDKRPLPPLTSLRFFAAFSIVLFHASGNWGLPVGMLNGSGVELFFILSGFILAYNYRSIPSFNAGLRVIGYRIARIWPLHLVTLAAAFAIYPPDHVYGDPDRLWALIPMVQAWLGNGLYALSGNSVSWTISVELAFYLLFPALTVLSSRVTIVVAVVATAAAAVWGLQHDGVDYQANEVSALAIFQTHPASFLMQFIAGMLACRWFLDRRAWPLSFAVATVLEIVALVLVWVFYINANDSVVAMGPYLRPPSSAWLVEHLCAIVFMLPLIVVLAMGRGAVSRILSTPVLVYLGEISFATYMCHTLVLAVVVPQGFGSESSWFAYIGAVYAMSALLYHVIERPMQRVIRQFVDSFLSKPTETLA